MTAGFSWFCAGSDLTGIWLIDSFSITVDIGVDSIGKLSFWTWLFMNPSSFWIIDVASVKFCSSCISWSSGDSSLEWLHWDWNLIIARNFARNCKLQLFFQNESQSKLDQPIFWSILCVMFGLKMITKRLWSQLLLIFTKFSGNHQNKSDYPKAWRYLQLQGRLNTTLVTILRIYSFS